jgi:hypothetical protein
MFTPSLNSTRCPVRTRLAIALTLLGGVSLAQPAFAGKPFFERKKPHANVGAGQPRPASRGIPIDSVIHFEFDKANRSQALRQPQRLHPNHFLGLDHTLVNKELRHAPSGNLSSGPVLSAEAQRDVAEANARATIQAAREAADAQKWTGSQARHRRLSNVAGNDRFQLGKRNDALERRAAPASETDRDAYYRAMMAEPDAIDLYYGSEGSWGTGADAAPYSYSD